MNQEAARVLLIGFGNPGRLDDGLGPALAEAIQQRNLPGTTVEANYQLTVEDAAQVAECDVVLFADADVGGPEPFWMKRIEGGPEATLGFSSHSVQPEAVLALARELFGAEPEAYVIGIRGYEFNEFGERLSPQAEANLADAVAHVESCIRRRDFQEARPEGGDLRSQSDPTS